MKINTLIRDANIILLLKHLQNQI